MRKAASIRFGIKERFDPAGIYDTENQNILTIVPASSPKFAFTQFDIAEEISQYGGGGLRSAGCIMSSMSASL